MFLRITYVVLALAVLYLSYDTFQRMQARHALMAAEDGYLSAPADADLTVVEFLDYSCPHCQSVHPILTEALRKDGRIRYIPRPVSYLGPEGLYAASVVYAAGRQGKFMETHEKLIGTYQVLLNNDPLLRDVARELDLDADALKTDALSPDTLKKIRENDHILKTLAQRGTPTYFIGKKMVYVPEGRLPTVEEFLKMFNEARGHE
ncbi:MAG: thioredoxin domain-containing protein [Alphaproteobacteria bacterium]|nr:thioredoxin domain-containing protein [Alphaproteobacteria bacterium]